MFIAWNFKGKGIEPKREPGGRFPSHNHTPDTASAHSTTAPVATSAWPANISERLATTSPHDTTRDLQVSRLENSMVQYH